MAGRPPSSYGSMHSDDEEEEEDEDDFEPPVKHAETKYSKMQLNYHKKQFEQNKHLRRFL